jgi:hypothetical protein
MATEPEMVTLEEAKEQVRLVSEALGQLHIAFARTIVNELGKEKGKKLILKAIKSYGSKVQLGAKGFKFYGMLERFDQFEVEGERRWRADGCAMGKVWHDLDEAELGHLYCFVDVFVAMTRNPERKVGHDKLFCPDGYCAGAVKQTTEQERKDFASENGDLKDLDYHL